MLCAAFEEGATANIQKWPQGIVPYVLSETFSVFTKAGLVSMMHHWENSSCVVFVPRTNQEDYVAFEPGEICCSSIGRTGDGMQQVLVHDGCIRDHTLTGVLQALIAVNSSAVIPQGDSDRDSTSDVTQNRIVHTQPGLQTHTTGVCTELQCGACIQLDPVSNSSGTITSPGYPVRYSHQLQCVWKLISPEGYSIELTLDDMDIEDHADCVFDFLDVFQLSKQGEILRYEKMCGSGSSKVLNVSSTAESAVIQLHTDSTYSIFRGFSLSYRLQLQERRSVSLCDAEDDNGGCEHTCIGDLQGQKTGCGCREGFQLTDDGLSCSDIDECAVRKGGCEHKCHNTEGSFYCTCERGYHIAEDQRTCTPCVRQLNSTSGDILSPGFPISYPHQQNCEWNLQPWSEHVLRITIDSLDINPSTKCELDYLKFEHGHFPHNRRLCGYYTNITYLVYSATSFRFRTLNVNTVYSGFQLHYEQVRSSDIGILDRVVWVDGAIVPYDQRLWVPPVS